MTIEDVKVVRMIAPNPELQKMMASVEKLALIVQNHKKWSEILEASDYDSDTKHVGTFETSNGEKHSIVADEIATFASYRVCEIEDTFVDFLVDLLEQAKASRAIVDFVDPPKPDPVDKVAIDEVLTAAVAWARWFGPWDSGNPDHIGGNDLADDMYNALVRAARSGALPQHIHPARS